MSTLDDIVAGRPAWHDRAACRGSSVVFFPERGGDTRPAKTICAGCPVRSECLQFALDNSEHHCIWGGLAARERRRLRRATTTTTSEETA